MALPWVVAPLVDALIERGELDEAEHWVTVTDLAANWPEVFGFTFLLDSLARLRLAQGRVAEALGLARECGRRQRAWGIRNPGFLPWGSTLAAALHATGRTTEALDVCDQQIDLARAFGVAREHGMGLLALGTITGDERHAARRGRRPARLPRPARARPRAHGARRPRAAARGARARRALRRDRARRPRPRRPRRHRRAAAPRAADRPHRGPGARRAAGGRRPRQPRRSPRPCG